MNRLIARFNISYPSFHLNVTLDAPAMGVRALFGPSGSGKTTVMRCLAGLERAPDGFFCLGEDVWQDDSRGIYVPIHRCPIGYVFQEARLFPHMNVRANLMYGFKRTSIEHRQISPDQVIDILGIEHLLDRRPHKLSGGEQQRIAIGRALLTSPRLLLLDEPLSSLDAQRKREILPFIQRLYLELRIPIVYVTHSINEILQVADLVALLQQGKVVALSSLSDMLSRLEMRRTMGHNMIGGVIDATVVAHEADFGLTRLECNGRFLHVPFRALNIGASLRACVFASDVSLSLCTPALDQCTEHVGRDNRGNQRRR